LPQHLETVISLDRNTARHWNRKCNYLDRYTKTQVQKL